MARRTKRAGTRHYPPETSSTRDTKRQPRPLPVKCVLCGGDRDVKAQNAESLRATIAGWIKRRPMLCTPCFRRLRSDLLTFENDPQPLAGVGHAVHEAG